MIAPVCIVDAIRIPRAASGKTGRYSNLSPVDLLKPLFRALPKRSRFDLNDVDDVLLGCATQYRGQGANLGKIAALYAGWPNTVPGGTVSRFCCSGQDAINLAAAKIASGAESLVVAGGVEHLSRVPMFADKGAWYSDSAVMKATRFIHMGVSADLLAAQAGFDRPALDGYSLRSHHRASAADADGAGARSLVTILDGRGAPLLERDNAIRSPAELANMGSLSPSFTGQLTDAATQLTEAYPEIAVEARHSAANAPALADGASLILLASAERCRDLGLTPRALVRHYANASDEPVRMLTGHIRATEKLLKATGLSPRDIQYWEVNESFAASVMMYQRHFDIVDDDINVHGGAIARGHPLGATGGNLISTLIDILEERQQRHGIVAIPGGAGVGVATLIERC